MMSFKTRNEITEVLKSAGLTLDYFTDQEINNILDEGISSGWMKAISVTILSKVMIYSSRVKSETDIGKKIDHLADLVKSSAYLSNLSVATSAQDRSITKSMKK